MENEEGNYSDDTIEDSGDEQEPMESAQSDHVELRVAPVEAQVQNSDSADELQTITVQVQYAAVASQASTSTAESMEPAIQSSSQSHHSTVDTAENQSTSGVKRSVKHDGESDEDADDGRLCPICMDVWSNSGSHRLSSLRCGHLFGHSCIVRWLQVGCSSGQRRCPQCNKKASMKEIRLLYARKLQVLDTVERDKLREELEAVQKEKNRLELELARANLNFKLHQEKITELKQKLEEMIATQAHGYNHTQQNITSEFQQTCSQGTARLTLDRSLEICKSGGCRVLAYNSWLNILCVSQRSTNNLFSGYGIKKIDALEFRPTHFMFLHPKAIRDLAFNPQRNDLLLSVSLDKSAKLLDVSNNIVIHSYTTDSPLWSCCWDPEDHNALFVGSQNGVVSKYDLRQTRGALCRLSVPGDMSPVTSLAALPSSAGRALPRGGLLACRLNSCWAYERNNDGYVGQQLPLDGPFTSLCYDNQTEHVLISTRPCVRSPHACHILYQLAQEDSSVVCNAVHTFRGGTSQKLLSRPCQLAVRGDTLVAAHQESNSFTAVWSVATGQQILRLPASDPVTDLCPLEVNNTQYLATLSEKMLRIYHVT